MEKKVYFTQWQGVDASISISLFEYDYIMRRKRGTHEWQVLHALTNVNMPNMYDIDWFNPDDYIKDAQQDRDPWFKPTEMYDTCGYESVEKMLEAWRTIDGRCFDDLQSYWGFAELFGGYYYKPYTEAQVRKRIGRALH